MQVSVSYAANIDDKNWAITVFFWVQDTPRLYEKYMLYLQRVTWM